MRTYPKAVKRDTALVIGRALFDTRRAWKHAFYRTYGKKARYSQRDMQLLIDTAESGIHYRGKEDIYMTPKARAALRYRDAIAGYIMENGGEAWGKKLHAHLKEAGYRGTLANMTKYLHNSRFFECIAHKQIRPSRRFDRLWRIR